MTRPWGGGGCGPGGGTCPQPHVPVELGALHQGVGVAVSDERLAAEAEEALWVVFLLPGHLHRGHRARAECAPHRSGSSRTSAGPSILPISLLCCDWKSLLPLGLSPTGCWPHGWTGAWGWLTVGLGQCWGEAGVTSCIPALNPSSPSLGPFMVPLARSTSLLPCALAHSSSLVLYP